MPIRHVSASLSLTAVLAASVTGCAAGSSGPSAAPSPPITATAAGSVLTTFEQVNNTANARFDSRLEAGVETAPQITMDQVGYVIQKYEHRPYAAFQYRNPLFYIPSLASGGQRWFAIDAVTGTGSNATHQFLLFAQQQPGAPWKLTAAPSAASAGTLPVAVSPAGNATAVAANDPRLTITPAQLAARHAELISSGTMNASFAAGRYTNNLINAIGTVKRAFGGAGWSYRDDWSETSYPVYALRTKDGGAVVWYFLKDRQSASKAIPLAKALPSGAVVKALTGKSQIAHQYTIDSITEFVAIVPPSGKVTIEAALTGNVAASAS